MSGRIADHAVSTGNQADVALARSWLLAELKALPKITMCQQTGERVTGRECPVHKVATCVKTYVQVESLMEHA